MQSRPAWRRARAALAALLVCAGIAPAGTVAAEAPSGSQRELQLEAAFLVNFVRYTEWPPRRFASADAPYVALVVGSERDAALVAAVADAAGSIGGRRIVVYRAEPAALGRAATARRLLRSSHVVFVRDGAGLSAGRLRALLDGAPVLTVGDAPGFAGDGGMFGLVRVDRHLAFEADPGAIRACGLAVSAKVLKLARAPRGRP